MKILSLLDHILKIYAEKNPLPSTEVKQILQLIANAGMCLLNVDRDGKITFTTRNSNVSEFQFTLKDIKDSSPDIKKYPYLKTLYVKVKEYSVDTATTTIVSVDIIGATSTEYSVEFSAATDLSVSVSSGLTLVEIKGLYATHADIVLTGTGTITISGKALIENEYIVSKNCNPVGEDCMLENDLIGSREHALQYLDWMAEILQMRNVYLFSDRGFPEIDEADIITIDTAFTDLKQVIITSTKVEYNGGLSGETEVLG